MGFNTSLIVLNDALHLIREDKEFGEKVADACSHMVSGESIVISSGNHYNAATVIETHHADCTVVIGFGRNSGTIMLPATCGEAHTPDGKYRLLKAMATSLGYKLTKKPPKKKS